MGTPESGQRSAIGRRMRVRCSISSESITAALCSGGVKPAGATITAVFRSMACADRASTSAASMRDIAAIVLMALRDRHRFRNHLAFPEYYQDERFPGRPQVRRAAPPPL